MGVKARDWSAGGPRSTVDSRALVGLLRERWGHAVCELDHENGYQLLVATILAAQSTDRRINMVTPELFRRYPTARDLAGADQRSLEELVHSTGFYRQKSKNLLAMARMVVDDFGGEIPRTMDELVRLPGVARKTANVVLGTVYGIPSGIVVDTHVKRLAGRLGLTGHTDPVKIERDLMAKIPEDSWIDFGHQLIWHGRRICHARSPECERCPLAPICPSAEVPR
ncbi:MAG: endonuclease III [Deltaproteobacteria bacterium]|nr:endonuclease III [Deltaproteobacteria bacterium]